MNQRWKINNKVSTPERIFDKIVNEMSRPVGIILFGADCDLKDDVYMRCVERIPSLADIDTKHTPITQTKTLFTESKNVLVALDFTCASSLKLRREAVEKLRLNGANSVVGIYVKFSKNLRWSSCPIGDNTINQQNDIIKRSRLTADEVDYPIVITEEEGVVI